MSSNIRDATFTIRHEFYLRDRYYRTKNRINFLEDCLEEQVLPRSAPSALYSNEHPFTDAARAYLKDGIKDLKHRATVLRSRFGEDLTHQLKTRLLHGSVKHKETIQNKLNQICSSSEWRHAGNAELINNI